MIDEQGRTYQDLITFTPNKILNINSKQRSLLDEYEKIINALRQENKTVKELHEFYYNPEEKGYDKTKKTIYSYVNILEENGLISVAGQRVTEGSRVVEKVYCLSALYFHDTTLSLSYWDTEESHEMTSDIGSILTGMTNNPAYAQATGASAIHELLKLSSSQEYFYILEVLDHLKENDDMQQLVAHYKNQGHDLVNILSTLLFYLRSHHLIENFREIEEYVT